MHDEPSSGEALHALVLAPDPEQGDRAALLLDRPDVRRAIAYLSADDARTLREQRELTAVPAPPFQEARRASFMAELMHAAGLDDVSIDAEGNVVGRRPPAGPLGPPATPWVVSAHLDTVFTEDTPIRVRTDGDTIRAPGICDDGRGLAALLALARALSEGRVPLRRPLLLVATVGEEGTGNLRGVRHLFSAEGAAGAGCAGFISLDGAGMDRIVNRSVGSQRHRLHLSGPGGHSWIDWGRPNPVHALGRVITALADLSLPGRPRTTLSVGRLAGGTGINAIATEAWLEFEVRSEDAAALDRVNERALDHVRTVLGRERGVRFTLESLGHRPAGATAPAAMLVRAAVAATRALDAEPELTVSSTDANVPMSLGIPALTLGAGGQGGGIHTTDEWYRNVRGPEGIARALLTLLVADEVAGSEEAV